MIGGAAFFADSVLTPAVSISSAVGGLGTLAASPLFDSESTLLITIVIIVLLFSIQSQGTVSLGPCVWRRYRDVVRLDCDNGPV